MTIKLVSQAPDITSEVLRLPTIIRRSLGQGDILAPETRYGATVVVAGVLGVFLTRPGRSKVVSEIYGVGHLIVGHDSTDFADQEGRWETIALTPVTLIHVPGPIFDRAFSSDLPFARAVAAAGQRQQRSMVAHRHLVQLPPTSRVAAVLLFLARSLGGGDPAAQPNLPLTQDLVAATAGISRQTTNQVLRALRRQGTLDVRRSMIKLQDLDHLGDLASGGRPALAAMPA